MHSPRPTFAQAFAVIKQRPRSAPTQKMYIVFALYGPRRRRASLLREGMIACRHACVLHCGHACGGGVQPVVLNTWVFLSTCMQCPACDSHAFCHSPASEALRDCVVLPHACCPTMCEAEALGVNSESCTCMSCPVCDFGIILCFATCQRPKSARVRLVNASFDMRCVRCR